jgi:serine/threonine-protein kinase
MAREEILTRGVRIDRYEIRELVGQGGMGQVYRAWDQSLRRDVAIKVLQTIDEEPMRRFSREAEAISKLANRNIVTILDYGVDAGRPYIVMEYLRGENLSERLKHGPMEVEEAVDMILGVCSGVLACHRCGILHRDLKPANVFLHETADFGTVIKVLDFGVAILTQKLSEGLTRPGQIIGTPRYYSPEQVKHVEIDEKSDQYGIALILYSALAGNSPFAGKEGPELARAILRSEYAYLREARPGVPEWIEDVFLKAASVDKDQRYPSVLEMARELVESATAAGLTLRTDCFAEAGDPLSSAATDETLLSSVDGENKSRTKLGIPPAHESTKGPASLTTKRGIPKADDATEDDLQVAPLVQSVPRPGNAVVVPIGPFQEVPTVDTTASLQTETAMDVSFSGPKFGPHGVSIERSPAFRPQPNPREKADWDLSKPKSPSPRVIGKHANGESGNGVPDQGRRKNQLVVAIIVIAALLGGGITWALARGGSKKSAEHNTPAVE